MSYRRSGKSAKNAAPAQAGNLKQTPLMLVVVVDTNIYVSALVFGGTPAFTLQLAAAGAFQLAVSETIQDELEETLVRKFGWHVEHFDQVATELWRDALHVKPSQPVNASRDPD